MASKAHPLGVQTGGAVGPGKVFIHRPIYDEALALLREGELCTIFDTRQVGKTSLVTRLVRGLEKSPERHVTVYVELAGMMGGADTIGDWFRAFARAIWTELAPRIAETTEPPAAVGDEDDVAEWRYQLEKSLLTKFGAWWNDRDDAPAQRLEAFFKELVAPPLKRIAPDGHLVIFVDEVDAVLTKPFSDAFFLLIRAMYNDRATTSDWRRPSPRICFCLVGSITPGELVKADVTPFNVGYALALLDFDRSRGDDLTALARFLAPTPDEAGLAGGNEILDAVLSWTGGHPFLTMTLCAHFRQNRTPLDAIDAEVQTLVAHTLSPDRPIQTGRGTHLATHFAWINSYLADMKRAPNRVGIYKLYRQIVKRGHGPDDHTADSQVLKLAGIVKKRPDDGRLVIRNRLYRVALDKGWLRVVVAHEPWTKLALAAAGGVVGTLMLIFIVSSYLQHEARKSANEHATRFREALARIELARDVPNATKAAEDAFRLLSKPDPERAVTAEALDDAIRKFWEYPSSELRQRGAHLLAQEPELDRAKGLLLLLAAELVAGRTTVSADLVRKFVTTLDGLVQHPELLTHTLREHDKQPSGVVWIDADTLALVDGAKLYRWTLSTGQRGAALKLVAEAPTIAHAGSGWLCVARQLKPPGVEPFRVGEQEVTVFRPRQGGYDELPRLHITGNGVACRASDTHIEVVSASGKNIQWVKRPRGSLTAPWTDPRAMSAGPHEISQVGFDSATQLLVGTSWDWGAAVWRLDNETLVATKQFMLEERRAGDFVTSAVFDDQVAVAGNRLQVYSLTAPQSLLWEVPEGKWWDSVSLGKRGVLLGRYALTEGSRRVEQGVEMFVGNTPRVTLRRRSADIHAVALFAGDEAGSEAFAMSAGKDKNLRVWQLDPHKQRMVGETLLAQAWIRWQLALGVTLDDAMTPVSLGEHPIRPASSIPGAHQQTIQRALTR